MQDPARRLPRPDALQALDDNVIALTYSADHRGDRRCRLAKLNAPLLGFVVGADHIEVVALLVRQHRGARHRKHFDRLHTFEQNGDEFAVIELANIASCLRLIREKRIGDFAAQRDRVGIGCDRIADEVELAGLCVGPPVRQPDTDDDGI